MMTHEQVPDSFLAGDAEAVAMVRGWVETVVRFQRWKFSDPEGLVQEILLKLLGAVRSSRYRADSGFRTFAHSVAVHTCIDAYRSERLRRTIEPVDPLDLEVPGGLNDPEEERARNERRELVGYIFQRLSDRCRQLWLWVYRDGLASRQVASLLKITPGNARVRVHRCLEEARAIATDIPGGSV